MAPLWSYLDHIPSLLSKHFDCTKEYINQKSRIKNGNCHKDTNKNIGEFNYVERYNTYMPLTRRGRCSSPALVQFLLLIIVFFYVFRCEISTETVRGSGRRAIYTCFRVHHVWIKIHFSKMRIQSSKPVKVHCKKKSRENNVNNLQQKTLTINKNVNIYTLNLHCTCVEMSCSDAKLSWKRVWI